MTVEDIFQSVLVRMAGKTAAPGCTIFDAVRGVQSIIVNLLLLKRSDLMVQMLEVTFMSGETYVSLPAGYASMAQRPYLVGKGVLSPLNGPATSELTVPGDPRYYDVIGRNLALFPPPADEAVVNLQAFVRPLAPEAMDDDIPFQGAFDEAYAYGALQIMLEGPGVLSDRGFVAMIETQVNGVLQAKAMADEQLMADAINFGNYN